jgi:hypothetical protein
MALAIAAGAVRTDCSALAAVVRIYYCVDFAAVCGIGVAISETSIAHRVLDQALALCAPFACGTNHSTSPAVLVVIGQIHRGVALPAIGDRSIGKANGCLARASTQCKWSPKCRNNIKYADRGPHMNSSHPLEPSFTWCAVIE